eukprot:Phypoly_transcript_08545.p1 GENE.Phypoly_transcript_08545~~Phypoly_transcript_08545.p1  ORF type:complete len:454 (+),score=42.65 Phypoly_transcript_08545:52-1362(+)
MGCLISCLACSAASCCVNATCSICGRSASCTKSTATRGIYVFQFLLVSVVAYLFSNYAYKWLEEVPVLKECTKNQAITCSGALAVYRITFGLSVYHAILAVFLIGVPHSRDWRASFNDGWFPVKFLLLCGITVGAFFIPNSFFTVYGWIMVVGAGFFILIQLVLLIEFAYSWNETWLRKMEDEEMDGNKRFYYFLLTATFTLIGGSIALTGVMYHFFGHSHCSLNIFFITLNLILGVLYCLLSIHPKVREGRPSSGLLQSAVIFLYSTYVVWSALMSEPTEGGCNPFNSYSKESKAFSLTLGAIFTIISVVYSTFRAGSAGDDILGTSTSSSSDIEKSPLVDSKDGDGEAAVQDDETEGTSYNYSFFHLSFALGGMYVCMLLTNWMTISGQRDESEYGVDSGYGSVWVKMVTSWVAVILYLWALVAPVLLPDREWN